MPKNGSINTSQHEGDIEIPLPQDIVDSLTLKDALKSGKNANKKVFHSGVICKGCKDSIIGVRYKCTICEDFDYCEKCEKKDKGNHGHPLLKIRTPEMCPIFIRCVLSNNNK